MNYPELIWHLIELVLQKDTNAVSFFLEKKELSATTHSVRLSYELFVT